MEMNMNIGKILDYGLAVTAVLVVAYCFYGMGQLIALASGG